MRSKKLAAWSMAELLVYVIIIATISLITIPLLSGRTESARRTAALHDVNRGISAALDNYEADNGRYPTTAQGLEALLIKPTSGPVPMNYNPGGYLRKKSDLIDPWGNPYIYKSPGDHNKYSYDLSSYGPDGKAGGEEENRDINNWE